MVHLLGGAALGREWLRRPRPGRRRSCHQAVAPGLTGSERHRRTSRDCRRIASMVGVPPSPRPLRCPTLTCVAAVRSQARLARADPRLGSTADDRDLEHDGFPADFRDSHVPPSPTAIHPQDLASPEFSYLSNVYGGPSKGRSGPRDAPPASSRPGERLDHRAGLGPEVHPSGPRTSAPDLARPDDPPRDMASMPGRKPIRQSDASAGFVNPANTATAESRGAGPGPGHAKAIDETAERLRGVVNLTDTVDTEVITREAPGKSPAPRASREALNGPLTMGLA